MLRLAMTRVGETLGPRIPAMRTLAVSIATLRWLLREVSAAETASQAGESWQDDSGQIFLVRGLMLRRSNARLAIASHDTSACVQSRIRSTDHNPTGWSPSSDYT